MKNANIEKLSSMVEQPAVYGPPPESNNITNEEGFNIGVLIILFVLGIFAIFSKKISKNSKFIIIIGLFIIGVISTILIKYISVL